MPMLGSNLTLRAGAKRKYTYLDWVASDGTLEILTDFMYESTAWPVEADVRVDEFLGYSDGSDSYWRMVVAAGSQSGDMQKMGVCAQFSSGGRPKLGAWMNNGIYDPENRGISDFLYSGRFRRHVIYQSADSPVQSTMYLMCDGQTAACRDPGWTRLHSVVPCPLTFFFCYSPATGRRTQHAVASVRSTAVYSSPSMGDKLADFVPVVDHSGSVGMLEQVSGSFYPSSGGGTICMDGVRIRFSDGVAS